MHRVCVLVATIVALCGCGMSPHEYLAEARQELAAGAYDDALAAAAAGLQSSPGGTTAWGLELAKLEACARSGRGEETFGQLEKLAGLHPDRLPATQYAASAGQLKAAGEGPASIQVLDLAMQRYPGDPLIEKMIGASKSGDVDASELEMLRTLGYIE
jgi:hypothetical protein